MCLGCAAFTRTCLRRSVRSIVTALRRQQSGFPYISSSYGLQCPPCQQRACIAIVLQAWRELFSQHILLTLLSASVQGGDIFVINSKARFQICMLTDHQRPPAYAGRSPCSAQMELMGCLFLHGPPGSSVSQHAPLWVTVSWLSLANRPQSSTSRVLRRCGGREW